MSELRDLYQEMILEHSKNPRNRGRLAEPDGCSEGFNPLCGDNVQVSVKTRDGKVESIGFEGSGCAISTASASMMTQVLQGKTIEEAREIFTVFHELVTGKLDPDQAAERMGKLMVFAGVREFPVRVKCATLPWHTLLAALDRRQDKVTTE